jgi:putative ABC transport system ATP-binding protein
VGALAGVDLDIDRGEFVAIMGPSGSGKSTLLNLLGCLDRPTSGRYELDGGDVTHLSSDDLAAVRNRKIGFVFQGFNLLARASALENVALPLLYSGVAAKERRRRAASMLERVGLLPHREHAPNQLSGGQQQRVAIARALVNDPALILADEPTGALDTQSSLAIMALFQELNRGGITVAVVTHEPEIARHAARVIRLRDGHLVADERVGQPLGGAELPIGVSPGSTLSP